MSIEKSDRAFPALGVERNFNVEGSEDISAYQHFPAPVDIDERAVLPILDNRYREVRFPLGSVFGYQAHLDVLGDRAIGLPQVDSGGCTADGIEQTNGNEFVGDMRLNGTGIEIIADNIRQTQSDARIEILGIPCGIPQLIPVVLFGRQGQAVGKWNQIVIPADTFQLGLVRKVEQVV